MTPARLAAIHAACFADAPRPWTAAEFAGFLDDSRVVLVAEPDGFALGRCAGAEAELLTLAVLPEARRRGIGRRVLGGFEARACAAGAQEAFLEVAEDNHPARALYRAAGYCAAGFRRDYYRPGDGRRIGALVLRKELRSAGGG